MLKLGNGEKLYVGYDLGDDYSQISFCTRTGEVETLSLVAGTENFNIPTVLCKREGVNQWFYGREALRYAENNQGILLKNVLSMAVDGESVQVEGKTLDPVALLTLFVKRSLGLLSQVSSPDKIDMLMFTCETLNHRMLEVLSQVAAGLKLKPEQVCFQSHTESFYNYMIHQPEELWNYPVLLCDYRENHITVYRMECNKRTTPVVVYIGNREYAFPAYQPMPDAETLRREKMERLDSEFLHLMTDVCQSGMLSAVYLIGEDYSEEWMKESLRFLCRGRRVFQGNNLYSKGACYGIQERQSASEAGKSHVFLGNDKLKANVGMKILRRGEESYFALLDAGVNWFEAEQTMECYLQDGNSVEFVITPLIGKKGRVVQMTLDDLQGSINRLRVRLYMKEESKMAVEITDLGFGEIRPASYHLWREEIGLY